MSVKEEILKPYIETPFRHSKIVDKDNALLAMEKYAKIVSIEFSEWIHDNYWIRDPFPRKGYEDDDLRYTNIAIADDTNIPFEEKTVEELYELFILETKKQKQ